MAAALLGSNTRRVDLLVLRGLLRGRPHRRLRQELAATSSPAGARGDSAGSAAQSKQRPGGLGPAWPFRAPPGRIAGRRRGRRRRTMSRMVRRCSSCIPTQVPDELGHVVAQRLAVEHHVHDHPARPGCRTSWNQPMKRLITAMGSASGSVTKKNAVRSAAGQQVPRLPCAPGSEQVLEQRVGVRGVAFRSRSDPPSAPWSPWPWPPPGWPSPCASRFCGSTASSAGAGRRRRMRRRDP